MLLFIVKLSRQQVLSALRRSEKGPPCKVGGLFRRFMGARPAFPPPAACGFLIGAVRAHGPACPRTGPLKREVELFFDVQSDYVCLYYLRRAP